MTAVQNSIITTPVNPREERRAMKVWMEEPPPVAFGQPEELYFYDCVHIILHYSFEELKWSLNQEFPGHSLLIIAILHIAVSEPITFPCIMHYARV